MHINAEEEKAGINKIYKWLSRSHWTFHVPFGKETNSHWNFLFRGHGSVELNLKGKFDVNGIWTLHLSQVVAHNFQDLVLTCSLIQNLSGWKWLKRKAIMFQQNKCVHKRWVIVGDTKCTLCHLLVFLYHLVFILLLKIQKGVKKHGTFVHISFLSRMLQEVVRFCCIIYTHSHICMCCVNV